MNHYTLVIQDLSDHSPRARAQVVEFISERFQISDELVALKLRELPVLFPDFIPEADLEEIEAKLQELGVQFQLDTSDSTNEPEQKIEPDAKDELAETDSSTTAKEKVEPLDSFELSFDDSPASESPTAPDRTSQNNSEHRVPNSESEPKGIEEDKVKEPDLTSLAFSFDDDLEPEAAPETPPPSSTEAESGVDPSEEDFGLLFDEEEPEGPSETLERPSPPEELVQEPTYESTPTSTPMEAVTLHPEEPEAEHNEQHTEEKPELKSITPESGKTFSGAFASTSQETPKAPTNSEEEALDSAAPEPVAIDEQSTAPAPLEDELDEVFDDSMVEYDHEEDEEYYEDEEWYEEEDSKANRKRLLAYGFTGISFMICVGLLLTQGLLRQREPQTSITLSNESIQALLAPNTKSRKNNNSTPAKAIDTRPRHRYEGDAATNYETNVGETTETGRSFTVAKITTAEHEVIALDLTIRTSPIRKLTPKEIVDGVAEPAWMDRFQAKKFEFESGTKTLDHIHPFTAKGSGRAYVKDKKGGGRAPGQIVVEGELNSDKRTITGTWTIFHGIGDSDAQAKNFAARVRGSKFRFHFQGEFQASLEEAPVLKEKHAANKKNRAK